MTAARRTLTATHWGAYEVLARDGEIVAIEPFRDDDGVDRCKLVFDPDLVLVRPQPRRAFQGWRYLDPRDAPPDLPRGRKANDLPPKLRAELAALLWPSLPLNQLATGPTNVGVIRRQIDAELVATLLIGRYTPATGNVRLVGGGHPPALVVRDGKVEELTAGGIPLGWPGAGSFEVVETHLGRGDTLIMYTDGLIESTRDILKGLVNLRRAAEETAGYPAPSLARALVDRALAGAMRQDDSLALVLRRRVAELPCDRREQSVRRRSGGRAGVHHDERAGAVRVLRHPRARAPLAEERGLLIAGDARDRNAGGDGQSLRRSRVHLTRRSHFGQHAPRNVEELQQLVVPREAVDVEEQRARRVRVVGDVPAGQLAHEPRVDRPERGTRIDAALLQELVDEGGLPVVDVGDDGDVADVLVHAAGAGGRGKKRPNVRGTQHECKAEGGDAASCWCSVKLGSAAELGELRLTPRPTGLRLASHPETVSF